MVQGAPVLKARPLGAKLPPEDNVPTPSSSLDSNCGRCYYLLAQHLLSHSYSGCSRG